MRVSMEETSVMNQQTKNQYIKVKKGSVGDTEILHREVCLPWTEG